MSMMIIISLLSVGYAIAIFALAIMIFQWLQNRLNSRPIVGAPSTYTDCGSKFGVVVYFDSKIPTDARLLGKFIIADIGIIEITRANIGTFKGKQVVRDALFCSNKNGYCDVCSSGGKLK